MNTGEPSARAKKVLNEMERIFMYSSRDESQCLREIQSALDAERREERARGEELAKRAEVLGKILALQEVHAVMDDSGISRFWVSNKIEELRSELAAKESHEPTNRRPLRFAPDARDAT